MSSPLFPDIVVNGTTIPAADIAAEAQHHPAPQGKPGLAWRMAARALVVRRLLLEEAERRSLAAAPQELAPGKHETEAEARIRAVMEEGVCPDPVTEADLRAAYDRAPGAYRAPALYQPAHILFAARPDDTPVRTRARERAKAALQTLRDNPRRFAELAREESDCPSRDAGGELGQIGSGETVPEFEAALRAAPLGEIHDQLVETRYGYHVLRLDMRADGAILPFEAVRPRLARACEKANWTRAARGFVQGLIDRAEISGLDLETIPAGPVPA